jgi:hypothetical protein
VLRGYLKIEFENYLSNREMGNSSSGENSHWVVMSNAGGRGKLYS